MADREGPGLRIWDVASGKPLRRFKDAPGGAEVIAYLPDGRSIVTGSQDGTALVWDVSDLADRTSARAARREDARNPLVRPRVGRRPVGRTGRHGR